MTRHEQTLTIVARCYECREAARLLLRERYDSTVQSWRQLIAERMAREQKSILQAALVIGQAIPPSDGVPLMMLMAATVEMIESEMIESA